MANENPKVNLALVQNLPESGSLVTGTLYMSPEEEGNFVKVAVSDASTVTIFDGSKYVTKEEIDEFEYTAATALNDLSTRIDDLSTRMDDIDVDLLVKVTYDELKELRDSSSLVPGMKYRMTDYDTRIFKPGADSMHHRFDLILLALSEDVLSEDCRAIQHEFTDDELSEYSEEEVHYFDGCELDAWRILYTIDNDTDRFDWVADGSIEYILAPVDVFSDYYSYRTLARNPEGDLPDGSTVTKEGIGNFRYYYNSLNSIYYKYFLDVSTLLYDSSYSINIGYEESANNSIDNGLLMYSTEFIPSYLADVSDYITGHSDFDDDWTFTTIFANYYNYENYGFNMGWFARDTQSDNKFIAQGYDTESGWFAYSYTDSDVKLTLWYNENEDYSLVMAILKNHNNVFYYKEYIFGKYIFPKYGYVSYIEHKLETDEIVDTGMKDISLTDFGGGIHLYADVDPDNGNITSFSAKVLRFNIDTSTHRYCFSDNYIFDNPGKIFVQYTIKENEDNSYPIYADASVFEYSQEERIANFSKGVIYGMIDEYGNDMPYDFKNIVYEAPIGFLTTFSGYIPDRSSKGRSLTKSGGDASLSTGHAGNMVYTFSRIDSSLNIYDATLKPINIIPINVNNGFDDSGAVVKGGENDVK